MTELRAALPTDLPAIEALLSAAGLPLDGAEKAFAHGVVAQDDGRIVAAAATERFPGAALLRSVAVREDRRGEGAGRALVERVERDTSEAGIPALYLLTETAASWFERLGYDRIEREAVPDAVRGSVEFTTACAETAVAMVKRISAWEGR